MKYFLSICIAILILDSCMESAKKTDKSKTILEKVDLLSASLDEQIKPFKNVAILDHHRMAKDLGVYTPPAVVTIFSDPSINSELIALNQLVGLDLPFKVLCYSEPDTSKASVAFTSAKFIAKRHGLDNASLNPFNEKMMTIMGNFPSEMISQTSVDSVDKDFGIVKISSDFDFQTTVQKLKEVVMGQSDTKWFGEIDHQAEADENQISINPTTLLLFGGPAPGGMAMVTSPKIGLDAFCQKLLVFENSENEVWVAYNDIVAFAELYYQTSTKPQQMINQRLKMTFTKAITNQTQE